MILEDRAVGAYLGMAVGDALGATVEFMLPREIQTQYGVHDRIRGGGWLHLKPGQVTDDTGMALALGEAILASGGIDIYTIAEAFNAWLRSKPVDVGHTVRRGIIHFRHTGEPWVSESPFDAGNGACMRTLPIALATLGQNEATVSAACRAQARITHHNPLSDAGTECVVRMIQAALQSASALDLLHGPVKALLAAYPAFRFRGRRRENPGAYIVETLQAVFQALFDTSTFSDCLVDVVNRGGDADTTGAIAGMIAGALYGVQAIPTPWLHDLDATIRRRCRQQALALVELSEQIPVHSLSQQGLRSPSAELQVITDNSGLAPPGALASSPALTSPTPGSCARESLPPVETTSLPRVCPGCGRKSSDAPLRLRSDPDNSRSVPAPSP